MMKKKITAIAILSIVLAGCFTINNMLALSATPGTNADPVASKSYVDTKFEELANLIRSSGGTVSTPVSSNIKDEILADVMDQLEIFYADSLGENGGRYVPVSADAGEIILGGEGTEIILRSGLATGYITGENGIVNATDGSEIQNNSLIKINNLLIVPRDDGRGVKAVTNSWFLIKCSYEILN